MLLRFCLCALFRISLDSVIVFESALDSVLSRFSASDCVCVCESMEVDSVNALDSAAPRFCVFS